MILHIDRVWSGCDKSRDIINSLGLSVVYLGFKRSYASQLLRMTILFPPFQSLYIPFSCFLALAKTSYTMLSISHDKWISPFYLQSVQIIFQHLTINCWVFVFFKNACVRTIKFLFMSTLLRILSRLGIEFYQMHFLQLLE